MTTSPRFPACAACAHVAITSRGPGRQNYRCTKFDGDCYALRFAGGACGPKGDGYEAKIAPKVKEAVVRPVVF